MESTVGNSSIQQTTMKCYEDFMPKNQVMESNIDKVGDDYTKKMKGYNQMRTSLFNSL